MSKKNLGSRTMIVIVAIAAIAIITSRFYFRLDVTEDDAYSLSDGSLAIAKKLEEKVEAKLYFSKSFSEMPVMVKQYGTRIEEVLREYAAASNGKLSIEVIDPKPDTDEEEWALKYGVEGIPTQTGDNIFLGVVFLAADKEVAIPFLDPNKEQFLEYDLSEALVKLRTGKKPKLGLLSSLPVMGMGPQMPGMPSQPGSEPWAVVNGLKNSFEVVEVSKDAMNIDKDINVLFIIHPKGFDDKVLYAIDQFVMRGGRLLVAVDPFSRSEMAMQQGAPGRMPQLSSDLDKLFKAYEIEYKSSEVVGDLSRGTPISAEGQRLTYPIYMTMMPHDLNRKSKITSQLKQMLYAEGGSVASKKDSKHSFEALLTTTPDANTVQAMMLSFQRPGDVARNFKTTGEKKVLAARVQGKFKSAFDGNPPEGSENKSTLKESKEDNIIVVIADVDFMHDSNAVNKMRFGNQVLMSPRNDNLNFVMNAAELLGGNQDLISIRSSGQISRPFTKVMEIQRMAQQRWQKEEEALSKQLESLQAKLGELQKQRTDGNRLTLSSSQQAEIKKFREEERVIRKRRREVRKNLREDIESLGHRLIAFNLLGTPICVAGFGIVVFRRRSRREREEKNHA